MGGFETILERIKKPLSFARKDDFLHLKSLGAIEAFMRKQFAELKRIKQDLAGLGEIEAIFFGFDTLSAAHKKERILRALSLLETLQQHSNALKDSPSVSRQEFVQEPAQSEGHSRLRPDAPIQYCKGIGPKRAELLKKLDIYTLEDALFYLPWRYEDRGNLKKIGRISYGSYETVMGSVVSAEVVSTRRRRLKIFELVITDKSGILVGSWFNQPFMQKVFRAGQTVILSGIVKSNPYRGGLAQIDNPEYEIMDENEPDALLHTGRIVPIYRTTAGLSVRVVRSLLKTVLDSCGAFVPDVIPEEIIKKHSFIRIAEALREVHFPELTKDISMLNRGMSPAHRRLSYEELFLLELGLALRKQGSSREKKGISFHDAGKLESAFRKKIPFTLTHAQERVIAEIKRDMIAEQPMNRLVQGDVGCGKTIVALIAALMAVENGYQACIMAPTEILAEQHYRNISSFLSDPLGIAVRSLTGRIRKKEREALLAEIASGTAHIIIGTHALIEEDVKFKRLGLAVIDEQHRFGVMQRSTLTSKGYEPDVLIMTATPIPRTLALTVYGDVDVSVIDELPPGRNPIVTRLYFESRRREAYQFIENELRKGRQAYVVYPLVEETEKSDLKAATEMAEHLQKDVFPQRKVGLVHGRMKSDEKDKVMTLFSSGALDILVSTTVIEVGVDVPNATAMVIEHPERFGLAQLHQLRGRVGRSGHQSYCLLMGPRMFAEETRERLDAFIRTNDGFKIAEEDLRMRGPGEFFGTRQSGLPDLRAANIIRDADLLEQARAEAFDLATCDPVLAQHPLLRETLRRKWQGKLRLAGVG